jgi:16S rRNA (cytidine1402-2'-O)-methyltransferase
VTTLLSAVGVGGSQFFFAGYLAKKSARLQRDLLQWKEWGVPVVFFETGPRVRKTLKILRETLPDYQVFLGRELTKMHEEILCIPLVERADFSAVKEKGEFAGLLEPKS